MGKCAGMFSRIAFSFMSERGVEMRSSGKRLFPPLLPKTTIITNVDSPDECSVVLIVSDSMAMAAHYEDANVALVGHTYLIKGMLSNELSFIAYTCAGEPPSCSFGFIQQS
uniref:Uncharacterized protein n=1 Tax=Quercus lobata TaxID=97700 RepID=A0A7N2QYY1_QUELO